MSDIEIRFSGILLANRKLLQPAKEEEYKAEKSQDWIPLPQGVHNPSLEGK
jgi:hypothetical protein